MALPIQSFLWPRMRHVIGLWVERTTALAPERVLWDSQNQPSVGLPYVGLRRRNFPLDGDNEETIVEVPLTVALTVTATTAGETVAFLLFGLRYAYTLQGGDDTEDARDALLALLAPDLMAAVAPTTTVAGFQPATAVASGTDAIDFAGFAVAPVRVIPIENATVVEGRDFRATSKGLRRAVVRVELFFPEQEVGFEMIDEYRDALVSSLLEEDTAHWLASRGLGVEQAARITAQDISAVSGATTQRREFFDVLFNAQSKRYSLPNPIDEVEAQPFEVIA